MRIILAILAALAVAFILMVILALAKKKSSVYGNEPEQRNRLEGKRVVFVENENEPENADGVRGHLEAVGESSHQAGFYEKYIKRGLDVLLSFGGFVVLSPVFLILAIAIYIDDPGPVLFTQKRMGQNKKYFKLHKFRSMKMCTPHDKPTHMLENPEQYITKVGKFLRAHSLDELPQIWDIFIGNMSVIGPRPGLWNQDLLTAERDKYGANDVRPGLTGWAQINGRDELEIPEKAKLDGEYCENMGVLMDARVFLGSLHVFGKDDSVVEGGTGEMKKSSDCTEKKKILFVANVAKEHINKFHLPSIQHFKKHGWIVDVACQADEDVPYCDHLYRCSWRRNPFTPDTMKGISELKRIINSGNYNVVYCHTPVGGLVARLAAQEARKHGTKVIYFAHGLHFFEGAPWINWAVYYPVEKKLAKSTDAMFLINDEDYERVKRNFGVQTVKIFPGIGVNFERLNIQDKEKIRTEYREKMAIPADAVVLIYVAELLPNKNQEMLLDMLKLVLTEKTNTKLLLVGPDHWNGRVNEMAEEKGIADKVICTGWRKDIGELMAVSDICVASSIREGFGLNLVEAMYCGLPVVASRNRGHITVIRNGENGFLVDSADEMAQKVLKIIDDVSLKDKFSHLDVSMYDAENVAEEIVNTIEGIIRNEAR